MNIVVQGGTSRSIPGMPFSFAARAEIGLPGTPEDFRAIDLGDALAQYWANGDDLKLRLYRERDEDPFGWIDIVIETVRSGDEEEPWMFEGSYTL